MGRLWKVIDGEPYMINPRLGVLALQALNPKEGRRKHVAKHRGRHYGKAHMAWVRSFRKRGRKHNPGRKRRYRRNAYPLGGTAVALNPRRKHHRRKRNPGVISRVSRGFLGLPPVMTIVWGGVGFIGTATLQGFLDTLVPVSWKTNADGSPSLLTKYGEIIASIIGVSWIGKTVLGRGPAAIAGIGGSIYGATQFAHDFLPGIIPGMRAYTPLQHSSSMSAYTPGRGLSAYGSSFPITQAMPGLAQGGRDTGMPGLAAPAFGAISTPDFAGAGGMNIIATRFRRFQ